MYVLYRRYNVPGTRYLTKKSNLYRYQVVDNRLYSVYLCFFNSIYTNIDIQISYWSIMFDCTL
jgi:hypothetical protein